MTFHYTKKYIQVTRNELIQRIKEQVKPKRFAHILRVEETALQLAERYSADLEAVSIAALLHDYTKNLPLDAMRQLAVKFWEEEQLSHQGGSVLHGFAAAQACYEQFGCTNSSILNAIAGHTIGWYEMDLVAKIVYIADYIEPERNFPEVEKVRILAEEDLDEAVWFKMTRTLQILIERRKPLYQGAIDIYNTWVSQREAIN